MPLARRSDEQEPSSRPSRLSSVARRTAGRLKAPAYRFVRWLNSPPGRGVLKCSLAYTIASLATFVSPLSAFLGRPGGKHVVATMTVYFHPARSAGSMIEAVMIAIVAVLYAELISLLSMATSVLVGAVWGLVTLAHVLVVIVFVGGGFGFIGWVKQKMGNPLVNVASTLASLAIISVVTKENAVVDNVFSNQKIVQVLKMLVMGITSTAAVNLLLWRVSARGLLRGSMGKVSTSLGDMLSMISRGFLDGSESDLALAEYVAASSAYSALHPQMMKNLREAKFEHYFVGHEAVYAAQRSIVKSMETLAQSIGGLRSASSPLIRLLEETKLSGTGSPSAQPEGPESHLYTLPTVTSPIEIDSKENEGMSWSRRLRREPHHCSPVEFFQIFVTSIRDPTEALGDALCRALREPHFVQRTADETTNNDHFSHGLSDALSSFNVARSKALQELYEHPTLKDASSPNLQAELEQIAAACGHFTFSLQSLSEEVTKYLDLIDDLKYAEQHGKRSWRWLWWWTKSGTGTLRLDSLEEEGLIKPIRKSAVPRGIPDSMVQQRDTFSWKTAPGASRLVAKASQNVLRFIRKMAKDDVLFGLKVGIGASLWAMLAFLDETREIYNHYRGEWGLLSFMIVCSMTVGASNTTGLSRFYGTMIGAVFSLVNWNVSRGNATALVVLGWLVSFWNFYLIVARGQAPLGRMTQLAYNVSVLYAFSASAGLDDDDGEDEGGSEPDMTEIVKHRVISVTCGILWGLIICRLIWPISARKKFKEGISMLCLQMGLIWKRGPLAILLRNDVSRNYLKTGEQAAMQRYAHRLESLRQSALHEFELRGPFPFESCGRIMRSTRRILDGFYAMSLVTQRSHELTPGEKALLQFTAPERAVLCDRICHIFQVIASSMMLEYPLTNAVPNIVALRNNLLSKVFQFRKTHPPASELDEEGSGSSSRDTDGDEDGVMDVVIEEKDYALLYAYVLVTGQVADELKVFEKEIEGLYGVLDENSVLLQ